VSTISSPVSPTAAPMDYGSFVICPSCFQQSDIWTEQCPCGHELLPDDRKVKLRKAPQAPAKRLQHRSERLAASEAVVDQEQALRDLSALRIQGATIDTAALLTLLMQLGRLDESCAEADAYVTARPEMANLAGPTQAALVELSRKCSANHDARPESWLRKALEEGKGDVNGRVPVASALVGVLLAQGRGPEALEIYATADAQLNAARKKTSKNAFVNTMGSGDAFAVGRYLQATNEMSTHRVQVLERNAVPAAAAGREVLAAAERLEQSGDVKAALAVVIDGSKRLTPTIERLTAVAAALPGSERRQAMSACDEMSHDLQKAQRRLAKLAKH